MTVTERTAEYRKALDVPISQLETDRIVKEILDRPENFDNIYRLTSDDKLLVSWRALWICDKLCRQKPEWLIPFREELTGRLMSCGHDGSKRLLLSILYHAPATKVPSVALLNFCLDAMLSPQESIGVQSLAIRMAYRLCEPEPELLYELRTILESTETEMYSTAVKSAVRNTLKKINQKEIKRKNKMFSDELEKISWEETTKAIYSKTDADVRRALSKEHCDVNDFMALISPAAAPYLETMARLSRKYTMERFGKTISMFVPLYITNSCTNSCVYCGFNHNNPMKRTILTEEEMVNEYKAIKKLAPFENLLLVTGENPAKAGVDYIERALLLAKPYFANLQIEVMPLKAEEYERLTHAGLNGVICFQETYNKANYNIYHPAA